MSKKPLTKADICKNALIKYPQTPIKTLANKIYEDNALIFKDLESVRSMLRYYSGLNGKNSRSVSKYKNLHRELTYNYNPFENIPESFETKREKYVLPKSITTLGVLSDIHFPYHNVEALKIAIDHLKDNNISGLLLNGDILDFYQLSDFSKDPSKPKMNKELELGRWFLKACRETFPNIPIYYKIGNHEMRLQRWLKVKAPEWIDSDEFRIDVLLRFGENKIILIDDYTIIQAGNLNILHGHEYRGAGGVYPARYIYQKTQTNTLCGHYHRPTEYQNKNMNDNYETSCTTGCLCELSPDYMPYNNWLHGFAVVHLNQDNTFRIENKIIKNGKIY